jgi:hypothetical protein
MKWYAAIPATAAVLLAVACADGVTDPTAPRLSPRAVSRDEITWTGNGTTGGACNSIYTAPYSVPIPPGGTTPGAGEQLWHFVLTRAASTGDALNATFDDGTDVKNLAAATVRGKLDGSSEANFFVITDAGAKLLSANAVNGDATPPGVSELTVSGCWQGGGGGHEAEILDISKVADGSYDRTWSYSVQKSVDQTGIVRQPAGSFTFTYTIVATNLGSTLGNFAVAGKITVTNPNAAPVGITDIADQLSDGTTCVVTGAAGASIPAAGSRDFSYTCPLNVTTIPSQLLNEATVTWPEQTLSDGSHLAGGSNDFTTGAIAFTLANDINTSAVVYDSFNGGLPTSLGTITSADASLTFHDSKQVTVGANQCVTTNNTATILTSESSAAAYLCATETGGLTIGYWQNKNGQAQLTNAGATAGVCNLTPYLRGFAPFQDLSATASCTAVATYVNNVVKAANASGASMNVMLKAQMLSTALSVFFTPSLGTAKIDLTHVCSTGIVGGTCSTFTDYSGFWGSSAMTVNALLTTAASQSNAGGSVWYANAKTTQEKAKNTFDTINNNLAWLAP